MSSANLPLRCRYNEETISFRTFPNDHNCGNICSKATGFHLNKLSKNDTLLNGWKFHPGDDQRWKDTAFNDNNWEPTDPKQDIQHFDEIKNAGIGWLSLHIRLDKSFANRQLVSSKPDEKKNVIFLSHLNEWLTSYHA